MKFKFNHVIAVLVLLFITSCANKKYLLQGNSNEKKKLIEFISQMRKQDKIQYDPVIVINEKVIKDSELKQIKIKGSEVQKISLIEKGNSGMTAIYGEQAINGVVLIETPPADYKPTSKFGDSNLVIFVDGKEVRRSILKYISSEEIESINVIKDKKAVKKYTSKDCDGVVLIILKKTKN